MPKFTVTIQREVRQIDEFTRVIEADSETDARNIGAERAFEANHNCPDDCEPNDYLELGDFYVDRVSDAD